MQLIFTKPRSLPAVGTCLLTWSAWAHVAIVDGDHVIDAMKGEGVRRRTRASFDAAFPGQVVVDVACQDDAAGIAFALAQMGKGYDSSALWGFLLPGRRWDDAESWFCSELAAAALRAAGFVIPGEPSRITPGRLRGITRPNAGPPPTKPRVQAGPPPTKPR